LHDHAEKYSREKYSNPEHSHLIELLNKEMTRYHTLACDRSFKKELVDCKERIKELQKAIYKRKNKFAI